MAQEAVRKPSILRRPSARAGDPPPSTNSDHVSLSSFASKAQRYAWPRRYPLTLSFSPLFPCRLSEL